MDHEDINNLKIRCRLHLRPYYMKVTSVRDKDGVYIYALTCEKCFQSIPITQEVEQELYTVFVQRQEVEMREQEERDKLVQEDGQTD